MNKRILLRGALLSFKYPLFLLMGGAEKMCFVKYKETPLATCE